MKLIVRIFTLILTAIIIALSGSCVPKSSVLSASTLEPVQTPTATLKPTATPSPEATETPIPSLSPEEQEALLDQEIQDFLSKEGQFTKEKMSEMAIWGSSFCYEDGNGTDLGILRIFNDNSDQYDDNLSVYGYLYRVSRNEDSNIILTMGFDGKDGNRFNTDLMILSNCYDAQSETDDEQRFGLSFATEEGLHLDDKHVRQFRATRSDEIFQYLENLTGKKVVADIAAKKVNLDELSNVGAKIFWKESNNRLPYTYNLISRLANNGIDTSAIGSSGKDIPLITSSSDINKVDFDTVPLVRGIRFRENG